MEWLPGKTKVLPEKRENPVTYVEILTKTFTFKI